MARARLAADEAVVLNACDFDKSKHGEIVCFYCRCRVKGVRAYTRNYEDEQIVVPAYFSLWPHVEHTQSCRYDIEQTVKKFVAYSRYVRKIDSDSTPIIEKIARGQAAEFRLHILMEALNKKTFGFRPPLNTAALRRPPVQPTGAEYVRTDRILNPYFRTAKGILALAARIQSHPDLEAWISLKYADQRIPWNKFLFEYDQYQQLYESLLAQKETGRVLRPVAIVARLFKEKDPVESGGERRVIGSNRVITSGDGKLAIRPVFYFRDRELAKQKSQEDILLVCGLPRIGPVVSPSRPKLNRRVDINISVVDPRQLCQYKPK